MAVFLKGRSECQDLIEQVNMLKGSPRKWVCTCQVRANVMTTYWFAIMREDVPVWCGEMQSFYLPVTCRKPCVCFRETQQVVPPETVAPETQRMIAEQPFENYQPYSGLHYAQGLLWKCSPDKKNWRLRWFVLDNSGFQYWSAHLKTFMKTINLTNVSLVTFWEGQWPALAAPTAALEAPSLATAGDAEGCSLTPNMWMCERCPKTGKTKRLWEFHILSESDLNFWHKKFTEHVTNLAINFSHTAPDSMAPPQKVAPVLREYLQEVNTAHKSHSVVMLQTAGGAIRPMTMWKQKSLGFYMLTSTTSAKVSELKENNKCTIYWGRPGHQLRCEAAIGVNTSPQLVTEAWKCYPQGLTRTRFVTASAACVLQVFIKDNTVCQGVWDEVIRATPLLTESAPRTTAVLRLLTAQLALCAQLTTLVEAVVKPVREARLLSANECERVFCNLDAIVAGHRRLKDALIARISGGHWHSSQLIGDIIWDHLNREMLCEYTFYFMNFVHVEDTLRLLAGNPRWTKFCESIKKKQTLLGHRFNDDSLITELRDFLAAPVQIVAHYVLVLKDILDETPAEHPDCPLLQWARVLLLKCVADLNRQLASKENHAALLRYQNKLSAPSGLALVSSGRWLLDECKVCALSGKRLTLLLLNDMLVLLHKKKCGQYSVEEQAALRDTTVAPQPEPATAVDVCNRSDGRVITSLSFEPDDRTTWLAKLQCAVDCECQASEQAALMSEEIVAPPVPASPVAKQVFQQCNLRASSAVEPE
eukprot:TRINITY_DN6527_c0_g1_i1.p1 TRINITY_DN6527_c0_g1~~TRINITY_DN6527_c0_g1_i1.p1  ORF type:complete len:793 (-),score=173.48 TRINITY_DN6527_c0_g1_i1:117-2396(-)